jgi:hypothetical protein
VKQAVVSGAVIAILMATGGCGSSGDAAIESSGDGGSDAATLGDGAGIDAGSDQRIDPIALGRSWTYDVTTFGTYPLCPAGQQTGSATSAATVDGKSAILVKSLCMNAGSSYYAIDGDVVQVDYQGTWLLALDAPVAEGHTWSDGASSFTWHDAGAVTVPAGTFNDCWSATQNVAYEAYTIFCRGVGPVRWYSKDASGDGFDAELESTSFQ